MKNGTQLELQNVVQYVSAAFSFFFNALLILLIALKSPKQLGAYKYLMMCISIHEILYSAIDVIVTPIFHTYRSTFLIIVKTEGRWLSPQVLLIIEAIFGGFFGFSMAIFALHFIYRFLVASGNKRLLASFHSWKFLLWLAGPVFYGVTWDFIGYYLMGPQDYTINYVGNNVLESLDLRSEQFTYIEAIYFEEGVNGDFIIHWAPWIGSLILISYIVSSLVTVVYFGVKCYFRIRNLVSHTTSSRSAHLQSQLFYALVSQAMIPIILMHLPGGAILILSFVGLEIGLLGETVSMTIALYPAIDPLPTIFVVKHYRNGLLDWCRMCKKGARTQNKATLSLSVMT